MLKILFPFRIQVADCDGVMRPVACLQDIVQLAQEKAERYNDDEAKRFVTETTAAAADHVAACAAREHAAKEGAPKRMAIKSNGDEPPAKAADDTNVTRNPAPAKAPAAKAKPKAKAKK